MTKYLHQPKISKKKTKKSKFEMIQKLNSKTLKKIQK